MDLRHVRLVNAAAFAAIALIAAGCGAARTLGGDASPAARDGQPRIPPKGSPPFFTVQGNAVDVLVVVDNSADMAEQQRALASSFRYLLDGCETAGGDGGRLQAGLALLRADD